MTRVFLILGLVLTCRAIATAAETIEVGQEVTIAAAGIGDGVRATPQVAFGSEVYLVVWREGWNGEGGAAVICAARVDQQGKLLDEKPLQLFAHEGAIAELPRVAFGGGVFLVVWQEFRSGHDNDIYATRIAPEGKNLEAKPIAVATGPGTQAVPDVATDGQDFLVAWQAVGDSDNAFTVRARSVSAKGRLGAEADIKSPWTKSAASPKLAFDGERYHLTFVAQSLLSVRLDSQGKQIENDPFVTLRGNLGSGIKFAHSVAAAPGQSVLTVCTRSQPDYWGWGGPGAMICIKQDVMGKIDPTLPKEDYPQSKLGNWLDFGREKKEGSPWPYGASATVWDGEQYLVVWQRQHITKSVSLNNSDLFASRVNGWKPLDTEGILVAGSEQEEAAPATASAGGGRMLCVYEQHQANGNVQIASRLLQTR